MVVPQHRPHAQVLQVQTLPPYMNHGRLQATFDALLGRAGDGGGGGADLRGRFRSLPATGEAGPGGLGREAVQLRMQRRLQQIPALGLLLH